MDVLFDAGTQMLVLFFIVACGVIARRTGLMDDSFDARLSALVINVTVPALVLDAALGSEASLGSDMVLLVLGCSVLFYLVIGGLAILIMRFLYRGTPASRAAHGFLMVFANTGFVGYPVVAGIFGHQAVLIAAIFNIIFNMLAFGPGAMVLEQTGESSHKGAPLSQRAKNMARALVSPSMIASYLAVVLTLLHVTDEGIIGQTCNMLGAATAPCAMLIVGSSLGKMRMKDMITDSWAWVTAFLRLIAVPVITFALFSLVIPGQHQLIAILTILAAMPAAANGTMLALAYGGDTMTMARVTFLSTLFSLLTLPVVAMLVV